MKFKKPLFSIIILSFLILPMLNSCGLYRPVSAKDYPPDPKERIKKNMEEGRGFKLFNKNNSGGKFDFASSNPLWRATLDTIDFMPLLTADYGGGIIVTDWFNNSDDENKSLKISIQFLSNEVRADALNVKIFKKNCVINKACKINKSNTSLNGEIKLAILKRAAVYEKQGVVKNKREYKLPGGDNNS